MASTTNQNAADVLTAVKLESTATLPSNMTTAYMTNQLVQSSSNTDVDTVRQTQMSSREVNRLFNRANMVSLMNEGANANDYIRRVMVAEDSRVTSADANVKREHYKLRTKLMMYEYLNMYYKLGVIVLIITTVVTLVMLLTAALWRADRMSVLWFSVVVLILFGLYLVFLVIVSSLLASRDRGSWTRINWRVTKEMADELKRGPRMDWKCASVAAASPKPSCQESARLYNYANQDAITPDMYKTIIPGLESKDGSLAAWAHYNIVGRGAGITWAGTGCESGVPCETAKALYSKMYKDVTPAVAWGDFVSRKSTNTPRVWPGAVCSDA